MKNKRTLVIGASTNPDRYSYQAIKSLKRAGHEVKAISVKKGEVDGVKFETEKLPFENIDTVTMYINPKLQEDYENYILDLSPNRVIFNPGTENAAFYPKLKKAGIKVEEACTLVLLSLGNY